MDQGPNTGLSQKVAITTGAASGIGLAITTKFARLGVKVCLVDIHETRLNQAVNDLQSKKLAAIGCVADLGKDLDLNSIGDKVLNTFGPVDILINNAGLQHVCDLEQFPADKWDQLSNIMLRSVFLLTQYFVPQMITNGWGRIINMASIHSLVASPYKSAYITAKHGLIGFTKACAIEVARKGVTVNAISPSYVRTTLVTNQIENLTRMHGLTEEQVLEQIMLSPMPQGELIEPDEIAEVVTFLCSEAARHINGHNLVMDGGWTIT